MALIFTVELSSNRPAIPMRPMMAGTHRKALIASDGPVSNRRLERLRVHLTGCKLVFRHHVHALPIVAYPARF